MKTFEKSGISTTVVIFIKTPFYKDTKLNHRLVFGEIKIRNVRHRDVIFSMFSLCFTGLSVTALYVFESEILHCQHDVTVNGLWTVSKTFNLQLAVIANYFAFVLLAFSSRDVDTFVIVFFLFLILRGLLSRTWGISWDKTITQHELKYCEIPRRTIKEGVDGR